MSKKKISIVIVVISVAIFGVFVGFSQEKLSSEPQYIDGISHTNLDVEGTTAGDIFDADYDGIIDKLDLCPSQPEIFNGISDIDGCPEVYGSGDQDIPDMVEGQDIPEMVEGQDIPEFRLAVGYGEWRGFTISDKPDVENIEKLLEFDSVQKAFDNADKQRAEKFDYGLAPPSKILNLSKGEPVFLAFQELSEEQPLKLHYGIYYVISDGKPYFISITFCPEGCGLYD